jgi:hypothetical protein
LIEVYILKHEIYHEEEIMATSSIFANFDITDSKKARAFVRALEKSAKDQPIVVEHEKTLVTDKKKVRALFQSSSQKH